MGVLLQGFYKMKPNVAVPSPADGDAAVPGWWDHVAEQAADFRRAGFTAVWLPPVLKTSAGARPGSDGSYLFRGVEVTIAGTLEQRAGDLVMLGTEDRPPVLLAPLQTADKIQWNHKAGVVRPLQEGEQLAYQRLVDRMKDASAPFSTTVTGPLRKSERGYVLYVRSGKQ